MPVCNVASDWPRTFLHPRCFCLALDSHPGIYEMIFNYMKTFHRPSLATPSAPRSLELYTNKYLMDEYDSMSSIPSVLPHDEYASGSFVSIRDCQPKSIGFDERLCFSEVDQVHL